MQQEKATSNTVKNKVVNVGLALGGLAGNNAYGAGVLQAAIDSPNLNPDIISCTSGQIHWVYQYLKVREEQKKQKKQKEQNEQKELRQLLEHDIKALSPVGIDMVDSMLVGLNAKEGIFRPALRELPINTLKNLGNSLSNIVTNAMSNWQTVFSCYQELANIFPAQTLVPIRGDNFFEDISNTFNWIDGETDGQPQNVGILFNSFNILEGEEYVYLNECARYLLGVEYKKCSPKQEVPDNRYRENTSYHPITSEAVRQGLWIYEYGEPHNVSTIDGAYYRQIMLSELTKACTIYVARPINRCWLGPFPSSWIGLQDLKTEVNFNGSYVGEKDKIFLINRLLKQGRFSPEAIERYHEIQLIELEIQTQRGFFDYAHESLDVFDQAYDDALQVFAKNAEKST